jgi:peroxiredoxin/outer membrane lipoprotein-sorting protein
MQSGTAALTIWDGRYLWRYDPVNNEYTKRPDAAPQLLSEYQGISAGGQAARVLREEVVDLEAGPVLCYVVEVGSPSVSDPPPEVEQKPVTYWIDKTRYLVLKQTRKAIFRLPGRKAEHVSTTTVTKALVGQPLPNALFEFSPPESAVQVDELSFGPKSTMIGKDLADFELKDSAGNIITNAGLRGKVVILRFGDTYPEDWDPLPFVELLYRAFKGEDAVILNVVTGRSKDQVEQLTKLGYQVPTALDPGGATAKKLGLSSGYGTILVDRGGKVLYHSNDCSSREIVKALRKAGVW